MMKKNNKKYVFLIVAFLFGVSTMATGQAIKVNLPTTILGTPNIGAEFTISQQLSLNGDILWAPYMSKKHEEVFRSLIGTLELRYYVKPKYYYTNDLFDGFYVGPYAMAGNFNIGLYKGENQDSFRYKGWGVSGGASLGYKFYLSKRFRLDVNLGVGYAHLQYDKFLLGGEWADYALSKKDTKAWIGPTKFGVNLTYNLFR